MSFDSRWLPAHSSREANDLGLSSPRFPRLTGRRGVERISDGRRKNALAFPAAGRSSHHPKAIELYRGKLILYGCGDFINDYQGISGHEELRSAWLCGVLNAGGERFGTRFEMLPGGRLAPAG